MTNIKHYDTAICILFGIILILGSCCRKERRVQELESPVLDVLNDSVCNYTIDKDTAVFGAIMYEISVFKFVGTNVLKPEQKE